jgi:putative ATP-binding cassette transporter
MAERIPMKQLAIVREHMDGLYQNFRNLIEGSRELKLNRPRGEFFVGKVIAPATEAFRAAFVRGLGGYTIINNVGTALFYLVVGLVLFVVPHWLVQSAGVMTTATLILLYLVRPITELTTMMPAVHQAGIALRKIHQLEGSLAGDGHEDVPALPAPAKQFDRLELRRVCHQYPAATEDSQFMLGPIDLTIHRGEVLFIIGGNGSGKTTLAMVLLGLYAPEQGQVLLNGEVVTTSTADAYRAQFSAVFADFHLFEQLLTTDQADLSERASAYVKEFGMSHKVKIDHGNFPTINLSTGQRKRLALISAYLEDRAIYVFDEWAADQDPVFKKIFYTALLPDLKARGKTVIVITHDDGYFDCADRIVKLQDGHLQPLANRSTDGDSVHSMPLVA